ncbi:MAG TPA: methyltransferase [Candidatus Polarisedimenticolaceae bacterium]|nr:methyltransferase [Candidatus Polarisedimenticolaceae bacterium]
MPHPSEPGPRELLLRTGFGYVASITLNVAIELRIADLLGKGPRPIEELARQSSADEDALYRALRLLASLGIFVEDPRRTFGNTPASELLRARGDESLHDTIRWLSDPFHLRIYAELLHSVRTGEPCFDKLFGKPIFEYLPHDPRESEIFNSAMTNFSASLIPAVLDVYDFGGIGTLVDVGGGHGEILCSILEKYPRMNGVLCDLAHVLDGAAEVIGRHGVGDRLRREPIDFFEGVPAGGDAYILKHIIHDWDEARARTILENIATAIGDRPGRVLLIEMVLAPGNAPHLGKFLDIEMLALPGGRERSEEEFRSLFASAGFDLARVIETESPVCVIEAVPSAARRARRPTAASPTADR